MGYKLLSGAVLGSTSCERKARVLINLSVLFKFISTYGILVGLPGAVK